MTELLGRAIAKIERLPSDLQDEAAEMLLNMVEGRRVVQLSPEQAQEVARRLQAPTEYATHEEVVAFFSHKSMA